MITNISFPTLLTLLRCLLIPFFIIFFYLPFDKASSISALIFIIAAITDWFDGLLARRWKQITKFGTFLDPIADKLMVTVGLVLVSEYFHTCWITIPAIIIVTREIIISGLRQWSSQISNIEIISPLRISKIKTTAQMLSLTILLWHPNTIITYIGIITLYIALFFTLWSMFSYFKIFQYNLLQ
ncbi:CDP-diacylglycerol--glycerol-3-phosphate 3-phosphatidyltransferase [Candidatus Pantoea edessiphila]|uniref:CDP-diacylglycerol--glycerol-3-phosphate 3-phosphatidyltransferase n=2 Tax=Candidatus Pantoea edessiphila TaxID=2044610 RepID=A0A2P5SX66_9GAMM|nr:CDP-diacylglycerol--glycerol-3-phosphate 3-phosphatidyltransferase [Candidatus Pantoea edessiphila]